MAALHPPRAEGQPSDRMATRSAPQVLEQLDTSVVSDRGGVWRMQLLKPSSRPQQFDGFGWIHFAEAVSYRGERHRRLL